MVICDVGKAKRWTALDLWCVFLFGAQSSNPFHRFSEFWQEKQSHLLLGKLTKSDILTVLGAWQPGCWHETKPVSRMISPDSESGTSDASKWMSGIQFSEASLLAETYTNLQLPWSWNLPIILVIVQLPRFLPVFQEWFSSLSVNSVSYLYSSNKFFFCLS